MKIVVLGAGVIGVTSAYYLAKAGHEVVVIDRQPHPALETSFANAGEISPGYASPWAAPGIPLKALKWLCMEHAPLILRPAIDREMIAWLAAMLRNCTAGRYAVNKERMVRLAEFSRDRLIELRAATGIEYDHGTRGTLQVFKTQKQLDGVGKDIEVLRAGGIPFELLDRDGCVGAEPGLDAVKYTLAGGLRLPNDETGDCYKFTNELAKLAAQQGVSFAFDTAILGLRAAGGVVEAVCTSRGDIHADAFLVALGSFSPQIVRPLGLRLPVYPVKGYSITVPVIQEPFAPLSTLMDETYKVAITRLGNRIRVGGMAEISGYSTDRPLRRLRTLGHSLTSLFPGASSLEGAALWSGLRPMTPDSTPVVGPTSIGNLFLNTGHGTLGWTMACGSGHVIADLMSGRSPAIDATVDPREENIWLFSAFAQALG